MNSRESLPCKTQKKLPADIFTKWPEVLFTKMIDHPKKSKEFESVLDALREIGWHYGGEVDKGGKPAYYLWRGFVGDLEEKSFNSLPAIANFYFEERCKNG